MHSKRFIWRFWNIYAICESNYYITIIICTWKLLKVLTNYKKTFNVLDNPAVYSTLIYNVFVQYTKPGMTLIIRLRDFLILIKIYGDENLKSNTKFEWYFFYLLLWINDIFYEHYFYIIVFIKTRIFWFFFLHTFHFMMTHTPLTKSQNFFLRLYP